MRSSSRSAMLAIALLLVAACAADPARESSAAPTARDVLVFGGTGQLGAEIVRRLVARGDRVTVFARAGSDRARLAGLPVEYATGDLLNAGEVAAAFKAHRFVAVVNAVRVEDGDIHFYEKTVGTIVAATQGSGVEHLIHHGAVGAGDNAANFTRLGWDKVPGLLDRLKDQGIGEKLIRDSGVRYTIIRNSRLWPDGTPSTGRAVLTEDQSVLTPMTRADLAIFTVECLGNAACFNKIYHVRDDSLSWPPPRPPT